MKALVIAMASFLFSSETQRSGQPGSKLVETFIDAVQSISEDNKTLTLSFQRQSEVFRISEEHPQYAEIKAKLENAQKIAQKIKVIAIIPSMTIQEIRA
jgi:hypothetical protein